MTEKGKGLETDLRNWAKGMGFKLGGNSSVVFRKLCSNERKLVWERVIREIRPTCEVEHIRKNLALRKMSQKVQLRQKLLEKEEEIKIREHDFEQSHQKLNILNCRMQAMKQRTKDLGMKTLILCYKKQDLEKKAVRYGELCQVANFFQQPVVNGSGDARSSCTKNVETSCQNAIRDCKAQIRELHELYKMKDVNMQSLHSKKESVMEFVHHQIKDFPIMNTWHELLNFIDALNEELHNLTQSNVKKEFQHLQAVKECIDLEMKKFMKLHLELLMAHHSLQHKINQNSSECDVLLDRTVGMLQGKLCHYKPGETAQESDEIRKWLELQIKCTELGIIKEALQNEIKNSKVQAKSANLEVLSLQQEKIKGVFKEIERLQADIRTNYMWLTKSYAGHIETKEKLKHNISKLSQTCALDEDGVATLNASLKGLHSAFQHELKEFMDLPLHLLDNNTFPLGHLPELADVLSAVESAPSAAPYSIVLQILEKKLYLDFLKTTQADTNELSSSLDALDISSLKTMENAATTAVNEVMKVVEKSIEENKAVAVKAEDNYRTWLEHPLRHAVPENLQIHGKNFQQWQSEYDVLLTTLIDLESGEEVPHMML